jgi:hypothetical protein
MQGGCVGAPSCVVRPRFCVQGMRTQTKSRLSRSRCSDRPRSACGLPMGRPYPVIQGTIACYFVGSSVRETWSTRLRPIRACAFSRRTTHSATWTGGLPGLSVDLKFAKAWAARGIAFQRLILRFESVSVLTEAADLARTSTSQWRLIHRLRRGTRCWNRSLHR